ncbi:flagellar basal body-associated protein FliL [Ureibacillus sinduriensis]|uniref:Flagellar protein FliL n=1 Tax=Ureibacillus sinduriensis BLB-1 = JCM 15800 TaxID=1384057 RepID=A0A0A3HRS4_9BACL|nr:flagellar basal body-associated protein FliL [Ureibacillus sinduriensis]KGR73900.1 flagellar basal body-associated protein FliL [Ureibacillus sinduriensis BLB-1 = JCM 15800]
MKNNKLLTVMLIILVSITLIGVVIFVLLTQFNKQSTAETHEPSIDEIIEASVDVTEITTNLADNRIIMLSLKIQTDSVEAAEELTKRDFQTKNLVITQLSEMAEDDLKGKEGKTTFESTVKSQLNELMQEGKVQQVYITSYIIQ